MHVTMKATLPMHVQGAGAAWRTVGSPEGWTPRERLLQGALTGSHGELCSASYTSELS